MVTLKTNFGDITLKLDTERTPKTAANFLAYAQEGFYDNTIFHRVIDGFMIQGGGFGPGMRSRDDRESIENEADKGGSNRRGTVAMARTSDPHSASSQFFINVKDNLFLDNKPGHWGYCVFGEVVEGMDVVDKIKAVRTTSRHGHEDVPAEDVIITEVILVEDDSVIDNAEKSESAEN